MTAASPDYEVLEFHSDTSHGHMVSMLQRRAARGIIIDLGCGSAPHAEPLRAAGFTYVGLDFNPNCVATLEKRGFPARLVDLRDLDGLSETLDAAASLGRAATGENTDLVAVLSLDVMEHLVDPHLVLHSLSTWMLEHSVPVLGVSVPNVTHRDLALKLLSARWDLTASGLLDATHLRFFTNSSLTSIMQRSGFREADRMDSSAEWSDQHWPLDSPVLHTTTPLGRFLNDLRDRSDEHGATYQFVRLFEPMPVEPASPTLLVVSTPEGQPFRLAVVADPEMSSHGLDDLRADLESQTSDAWSLTSAGAIVASGCTHVAFVGDGQRLGTNWVQQFSDAAPSCRGMLLRCATDASLLPADLSDPWADRFDLIEHLGELATPGVALAVPVAAIDALGFDLDRQHMQLAASVGADLASYCGVRDTGAAAAAASRWRLSDDRHWGVDTDRPAPVLVERSDVAEFATLHERAQLLRQRCDELEAQLTALADDNHWLNAELRVSPVRALRRLLRRPGRLS